MKKIIDKENFNGGGCLGAFASAIGGVAGVALTLATGGSTIVLFGAFLVMQGGAMSMYDCKK